MIMPINDISHTEGRVNMGRSPALRIGCGGGALIDGALQGKGPRGCSIIVTMLGLQVEHATLGVDLKPTSYGMGACVHVNRIDAEA